MMRLIATAQPETGHASSCEELTRSQYARVFKLCRLLLVDHHEAEEVTQEVFLKLVREWQAGGQIRSWEAWLTRVAVNACRDRQRSLWWRWRRKGYTELQETDCPSPQPTPEQHALSREQQDRLWRCFRTLSPRQREVFVLRRMEGLSNENAAKMLGLSSGSIKRHLFHAIKNLQQALGDLT
jgi:RNA polymerase sigma-70 factor (ECF subfamily)